MRRTVVEQLTGTLATGLAERFKLVQSHLEAVHKGLGEMRTLADGVGDLKRVLSNVKTRGIFGEVQLGAILEQLLAPDQYGANVRVDPSRGDFVEYAVRLPGRDEAPGSCVWLPVDAKFPMEEYVRLQDAAERADAEGVRDAAAGIARSVKQSAARIRDKYVGLEWTTDFGIMFLPTEGLHAEVLRQPGLVEQVHREYHVVIAGPTTFAAILTSLRVGFRTLAFQKHSSEVWRVLSAVKAEFERFGDVLAKLRRQIEIAASTVDETEKRRRMMDRKLRDVERLPSGEEGAALFGPAAPPALRAVDGPEEETTDAAEDVMDAIEGEGGRT
jgi:DNA recombination protein RmuC